MLGPQERQRLQIEEAELQKRRADLDAQIRKLEDELDRTRRRLREVRDQLDHPAVPKQ